MLTINPRAAEKLVWLIVIWTVSVLALGEFQ
ncbi:DUF2474 family protein [Klebsiella pneumoniae]|nr:DUF2474 family protein [Klebsiella pneumoniae]